MILIYDDNIKHYNHGIYNINFQKTTNNISRNNNKNRVQNNGKNTSNLFINKYNQKKSVYNELIVEMKNLILKYSKLSLNIFYLYI